MCLPKPCVEILTLVPVNMILLGNKVSVDIIRLRWGHPGLGWGWPTDRCPYKRREIWTQTHTDPEREGHMMAEADTGVRCGQAQESRQAPETGKEAQNRFSLGPPEGTNPGTSLISDFQPPEVWETKFLLFWDSQSAGTCSGSPRKWVHQPRNALF